MSKCVESWWVEELPNGVVHLLINCTQKEIYFHAYGDYDFIIAGSEDEFDGLVDGEFFNFSVPDFLPAEKAWLWLQTNMKNKDQLSFYYIPYQRGWNRDKKIIVKSENNECNR